MLKQSIIVALVVLLATTFSMAQSKPKKKKKAKADTAQPNTLEPYYPKENLAPKKTRRSSKKGPTYNSEQEYYERLAALDKTRRKNERMQELPQYSDPMYFGHKHPPKKRSPKKMRFCKVCGIRH